MTATTIDARFERGAYCRLRSISLKIALLSQSGVGEAEVCRFTDDDVIQDANAEQGAGAHKTVRALVVLPARCRVSGDVVVQKEVLSTKRAVCSFQPDGTPHAGWTTGFQIGIC
jgi:hypothetical protein